MKKFRILSVLSTILSVIVVALALSQLLGIWENAIYVYEPLIGIVMILQAISFWNSNRKAAVTQLIAAAVVLGTALFIILAR